MTRFRIASRAALVVAVVLIGVAPARAQDELAGQAVHRGPRNGAVSGAGPTVPIEVLYTDLVGHPTADVPGRPGLHFVAFDRPYGNIAGNWGLTAITDAAAPNEEVVLFDDAVVAMEGETIGATSELYGPFDTQLAVDPLGRAIVVATNTDAPDSSDEVLVGIHTVDPPLVIAREGTAIDELPGVSLGATLDSVALTLDESDDLRISFHADGLTGVPTAENELLVINGEIGPRTEITVPPGQAGTPQPWENFLLGRLWTSEVGDDWMAQGDLTGDTGTDGVVVVNGAVVVQEGVILPGSGFAEPVDANGIVGVTMSANGSWFVRGNNDATEQDWIYSDGQVLVTNGDPVVPGSTEVWTDAEYSDLFFFHVPDQRGHVVVGGVSDGPTPANGLLVVAGPHGFVVAREDDPFDLDGDGTPDDGFRFHTFGNDDGVLTGDGWLYFVASIRDASGVQIGEGFFRADLRCHLMPFIDDFEAGDTEAWCAAQL